MKIRAPRGMNDVLPEEVRAWRRVEEVFRRAAELYGYGEVRTPLLEDTSLFVREIGETSDVVEKEMYSFERHGDGLTVRPEGTAGAARAYVEHNLVNREPITKWYYLGPMFRGERPAKGRYRQFHQIGCELYGDPGPFADAEMIALVVSVLKELGVEGLSVHVNSLGGPEAREKYRGALLEYFRPLADKLSEDSQRRLEKNPLRILDSKDPKDRALSADAPAMTDVLTAEDKAHFDGVLAALDGFGISYVVDRTLVRGLDYYTRTLFEVKTTAADLGAQNTLCGGGRYDNMIQSLGGAKVPAIGFAMGVERLLVAMKPLEAETTSAVYIAMVVEAGAFATKAISLAGRLAQTLRDRGVRVELDARPTRLKNMIRRAEALGAKHLVIIGDSEAESGEVAIKDLAAHSQETKSFDDAVRRLSGAVA